MNMNNQNQVILDRVVKGLVYKSEDELGASYHRLLTANMTESTLIKLESTKFSIKALTEIFDGMLKNGDINAKFHQLVVGSIGGVQEGGTMNEVLACKAKSTEYKLFISLHKIDSINCAFTLYGSFMFKPMSVFKISVGAFGIVACVACCAALLTVSALAIPTTLVLGAGALGGGLGGAAFVASGADDSLSVVEQNDCDVLFARSLLRNGYIRPNATNNGYLIREE